VTVVACGPENSGTRLLHKVLTLYLEIDAVHRSMPHAGEWWGPAPDERYVVIVRRPDVTCLSILGRHPALVRDIAEARANWDRALRTLAAIPGAFWITYEALMIEPVIQADSIATWLGVEPSGTMPEMIDANVKWLSALAVDR
jgi:hypothetical protein